MFSAVLGLASAGIGLFGSMSAANQQAELAYAQMAQQERQFTRQMDMQMLQFGMGQDSMRAQREENAYLRQIEQMNRLTSQQERQFDISEMNWLRNQQSEERQYMLNRQLQVDRDAARQQAMQIEQLLRNQQITQEERQFALQQLEYAQSVARGERDEDMTRFYQEREQRQFERQFQVQQYQTMRQQAMQERGVEMDRRNRVTGQIDQLREALQLAHHNLGPMPERPGITREDIDADARRREDIYMADVDRAADRVASVNEANMMRGGVDRSTGATARRGEITERIAQEYNRARERARDEALRYITGVQGTLFNEYNAAMGERGLTLQEVMGTQGAGIDQMMQMPGLPSAMMNDYLQMQSGVYDRGLQSANNYQAPIPINTAVWQQGVDPGMGPTLTPSSVSANAVGVRSGVFNPYGQNISDPAAFMNIAGALGSSALNARTNTLSNQMSMWDKASNSAGLAFDSFTKSLGGFGKVASDRGWFGTSSTPANTGFMNITNQAEWPTTWSR
jgi:hypothetical protein